MSASNFAHINLSESVFNSCGMVGTQFVDCNWEDAMIDGIPVRDLLDAYKQIHKEN